MKLHNKFSLGADPELFLIDENGQPKSAIGIIEGTKEDPQDISNTGHSVQVDNVLLEFNVPPANTSKQMYKDIQFVLDWFKNNIPKEHGLEIVSSKVFPKSELNCDKACEFGCDPDYNAWTRKMNPKPVCENKELRSAGGHIHISYPGYNMNTSIALIKALDMFLGVPSVLYDNDIMRRELYGKAGCFRFKQYGKDAGGVEYRTLSNFWISKQEFVDLVFKQIDKAISFVSNNPELTLQSNLGLRICDIINTGNQNRAHKLIKDYNIL